MVQQDRNIMALVYVLAHARSLRRKQRGIYPLVIQELEQTLLSRKKTDRVGLPGLEKGREGVIAAGAIIIRAVMETLGMSSVLVSDLGLREGVLIDLAMQL